MAPWDMDSVGVFDEQTGKLELVSIVADIGSGTAMYGGAVTIAEGEVLLAPFNAGGIGLFNAQTSTFRYIDISGVVAGPAKFSSAAVAPSGIVVLVPWSAAGVGLFDVKTSRFSLLDIDVPTLSTQGGRFVGAAVMAGGITVMAPTDADGVGVVYLPPDCDTLRVQYSGACTGAGAEYTCEMEAAGGKNGAMKHSSAPFPAGCHERRVELKTQHYQRGCPCDIPA